jgi:hypothetical protein
LQKSAAVSDESTASIIKVQEKAKQTATAIEDGDSMKLRSVV